MNRKLERGLEGLVAAERRRTDRAAVCSCATRGCREYGREVAVAMSSGDRAAPGPVGCWRCGGALVIRRIVEAR